MGTISNSKPSGPSPEMYSQVTVATLQPGDQKVYALFMTHGCTHYIHSHTQGPIEVLSEHVAWLAR